MHALRTWLCLSTLLLPGAAAQEILFIRGGPGTGGFLEGGADEQLSDVFDTSTAPGNHGWGELHLLLRTEGYSISQVIEGPITDNTPIDLAALPLADFDIVVFGSNNADYDGAAAQLLADWVCGGGAALFISDANWGTDWGDAPSSDQPFLDHFDLVMNQDRGTYAIDEATGDFAVPEHPILAGPDGVDGSADDVSIFDGEGVSPITVVDLLPGVEPRVLAPAEGQMKLNDSMGSGTVVLAGPDDGALVALEYGLGRVAGHFDRNTFFNANGAGSQLTKFDNTQYARNLFRWLANAGGDYGEPCADANGIDPRLSLSGCPRPGETLELSISDGPGGALAVMVFGLGQAAGLSVGLCPLHVWPLINPQVVFLLSGSGPGEGALDLQLLLPTDLPQIPFTMQALMPGAGPLGTFAGTNGVAIHVH